MFNSMKSCVYVHQIRYIQKLTTLFEQTKQQQHADTLLNQESSNYL